MRVLALLASTLLSALLLSDFVVGRKVLIASNEIDGRIDTKKWVTTETRLEKIVEALAASDLVSKDDLRFAHHRTGRDNPLSALAFDVFKEVVAEILTATVGNFFGFQTKRTANDFNILSMVLGAVKKNTIQKRMGCPT